MMFTIFQKWNSDLTCFQIKYNFLRQLKKAWVDFFFFFLIKIKLLTTISSHLWHLPRHEHSRGSELAIFTESVSIYINSSCMSKSAHTARWEAEMSVPDIATRILFHPITTPLHDDGIKAPHCAACAWNPPRQMLLLGSSNLMVI